MLYYSMLGFYFLNETFFLAIRNNKTGKRSLMAFLK